MGKRVLIPLPTEDFDPTECAVPWLALRRQGIQIDFATPRGQTARCDMRMLNGTGLGILAPILAADQNGREAYAKLKQAAEFKSPLSWTDIHDANYDGVMLPGGHAPGMKPYLESKLLQNFVTECFNRGFTVKDRSYLSASWPGDAHRFAYELIAMLG